MKVRALLKCFHTSLYLIKIDRYGGSQAPILYSTWVSACDKQLNSQISTFREYRFIMAST